MRLDNELWMRKAAEKEDELGTILWSGPDSRRFSVDTKMRVLVTGGAGYIGSNLMHYLNPDSFCHLLEIHSMSLPPMGSGLVTPTTYSARILPFELMRY